MSVVCPRGHSSEAADYCDVCGTPMTAPVFVAPAPPPPSTAPPAFDPGATAVSGVAVGGSSIAGAGGGKVCPACGAGNPSGTTFCGDCGAILDAAPPVPLAEAAPAWVAPAWEVVATADEAWFDTVHAEGLAFPTMYLDRRFTLSGNVVTIGRRSTRLGIYPDIDLSAAPEDIGVSRQHAVLRATTDGAWAIVDPGSANGTYLNDDDRPLPTNQVVALADGDRIHVGAWTTITFHLVNAIW
jgi:FHA domain/Double zinc ribbon